MTCASGDGHAGAESLGRVELTRTANDPGDGLLHSRGGPLNPGKAAQQRVGICIPLHLCIANAFGNLVL